MEQETWLNNVYKNMASLIPESKEVFLNKLKNKINFNYDKITETTLRNDRSYILTESQVNEYRWILNPNSWEVNNYSKFLDIVEKTPRHLKGFLTQHTMEEITDKTWITYNLKGYDVA